MNKEHNKQFRMFGNVQGVLDEHTAVWTPIKAFTECKNNFDEIYSRIIELNKKTGADTKGATRTKDNMRESLAIKLSVIAGVIHAYGSVTGNEELLQTGDVSKAQLLKVKETEVVAIADPIITEARKYLNELADYGLIEISISEAESTLDDFCGLIGKPRQIKNKVYSAISSIDELVDQGKIILTDRLDKLMLIFEQSNPEFYNQYKRARVVVD